MKLDELDIDDVGLSDVDDNGQVFDEDTFEKPWLTGSEEVEEEPAGEEGEPAPETEDDLVTVLLRDKGINPDAIKFVTDSGEVEEKSFNDLSREEQLQLLNFKDEEDNYGLIDEEVELLNEIRNNNLSVDEYKNYIGRQAIQEFLAKNTEDVPNYQVDSISDDELYILDLKAKVPELTEDEMAAELELAKQNESLYQKKVQGIRNEYKQKEELLIQQEEAEAAAEQERLAQEFENTIIATLEENDTIDLGESSLTLSEDDMNEIASFILDKDVAGVRHIAKALNDPKTLVGMAWYALKGQEAFGQISAYYKQKITEASKYNYNKGFEDAKAGRAANTAKSVVRKPSKAPQKKILTINDLD